MKTTKLFLGSLLLSTISMSSFALGKDFCAAGMCSFNSLSKAGDSAQFYCDAAPEVTKASFQDHNVNVKGFNANGELVITRFAASKINRFYFTVTPDLNRPKLSLQTVTYTANGKMTCSIGTGGRTFQFYSIHNIL